MMYDDNCYYWIIKFYIDNMMYEAGMPICEYNFHGSRQQAIMYAKSQVKMFGMQAKYELEKQ